MQSKIQTILVPTDFSIRSLQIVRHALDRNPNNQFNIIQATGLNLSGYITDLLFFSRKDVIRNLSGEVFIEACQIIRNKYVSQINSMRCEIFTGFSQAAFNLFIEGNRIDKIYIPTNQLSFNNPCFDIIPFMRRSKVPQQIMSWEESIEVQENHLGELFKSWA